MITNEELLTAALKRVGARLGVTGTIYNDHTLWFVKWEGAMYLSSDAMNFEELLSYLLGIEDCFNYLQIKNGKK